MSAKTLNTKLVYDKARRTIVRHMFWQCVTCTHDNANEGYACGGCGAQGPVSLGQQKWNSARQSPGNIEV